VPSTKHASMSSSNITRLRTSKAGRGVHCLKSFWYVSPLLKFYVYVQSAIILLSKVFVKERKPNTLRSSILSVAQYRA
jgi:hypothetical protein